jgi:hypothetical protein
MVYALSEDGGVGSGANAICDHHRDELTATGQPIDAVATALGISTKENAMSHTTETLPPTDPANAEPDVKKAAKKAAKKGKRSTPIADAAHREAAGLPPIKSKKAKPTKAAREKGLAGELMTFALRIPKYTSVTLHEEAGPGRASKVVHALIDSYIADHSVRNAINAAIENATK